MAIDRMSSPGNEKVLRYGGAALAVLVVVWILWPFNSVPTGSRGVIFT